jgi:hypothetical protein
MVARIALKVRRPAKIPPIPGMKIIECCLLVSYCKGNGVVLATICGFQFREPTSLSSQGKLMKSPLVSAASDEVEIPAQTFKWALIRQGEPDNLHSHSY